MPVADPTRPFGDPNCSTSQDQCSGHFLPPEKMIESKEEPMIQPPSVVLKEFFQSLQGSEPTDEMLQSMARKTLLPVSEVQLWLEHLHTVHTNRKRGATKAALTRKQETTPQVRQVYKCGVCQALYLEETEEEEVWIGCELCDQWFHSVCVNIDLQCVPDKFFLQVL